MKVRWAPLAIDRVAETAAYIADDNPIASKKWIRDAFFHVEQLGRFPKSGTQIPETPRKDIRELAWRNYRIIYRLDPHQISF